MTEAEIREEKKAQEEYKTAWIEAEYIVAGWGIMNSKEWMITPICAGAS